MITLPQGRSERLAAASIVAAVILLPACVGAVIGLGEPRMIAVAALPVAVLVLAALSLEARWALVFLAFGVGYFGEPLSNRFALGGTGIWLSDIIIALAVGGWLVEWLASPADRRPRLPRTRLLGLPVLLLTIALFIGAARGQERYGVSLIGMPLRLAVYAVIAAAITDLSPRKAVKALTWVFYTGAAYQFALALFHIATGTSATEHDALSTGGIRYIGITAATYAAGTVILATINLASTRKHKALDLVMLMISSFIVLVSYTRTVWLALGLVLLIYFVVSGGVRRAVLGSVPVVLPFLVIGLLGVATALPDLITTFVERFQTPASQDSSVDWRTHAYRAVLSGVSEEPVLGVGFGRTTSFSINGQPNYVTGDPHNGYIYAYAGGGLLALGALIYLILSYLRDVAARWRWADEDGRTLIAFCMGLWLVFMIHAAAEPFFTEPISLLSIWILMLLPALVRPPAPRPPARRPAPSRTTAEPALVA